MIRVRTSPPRPTGSVACRLLLDGPLSGAWNMAVDEVLLQSAAERQVASLRFYSWQEPTLSLGYFQPYAERQGHAASRDCRVVRRSSGGGAIVHDQELTYSLAWPLLDGASVDVRWLYDAAHESLIALLEANGLAPAQVPEKDDSHPAGSPAAAEPFLCFQRRAPGDVVLLGHKVCGSAQRRRQGAVLQHGSLLLAQSVAAPELPGLAEIAGKTFRADEVAHAWGHGLADRLNLHLGTGQLDGQERSAVQQLALEKYDSARWTRKR